MGRCSTGHTQIRHHPLLQMLRRTEICYALPRATDFCPIGGHETCPLAATNTAHWWPRKPARRADGRRCGCQVRAVTRPVRRALGIVNCQISWPTFSTLSVLPLVPAKSIFRAAWTNPWCDGLQLADTAEPGDRGGKPSDRPELTIANLSSKEGTRPPLHSLKVQPAPIHPETRRRTNNVAKVRHIAWHPTPQEITELMAAARSLRPPLTAATFQTMIGLMASTGPRLREALALDR